MHRLDANRYAVESTPRSNRSKADAQRKNQGQANDESAQKVARKGLKSTEMSVRAIALAGLVVIATTQSSFAISVPVDTDAAGWNGFCVGMFQDLRRQAEEGNNQVQFDQSKRRLDNLADDVFVMMYRKSWTVTSDRDLWINEGQQIAGRDFWDAPVDMRQTIMMDRRRFLDRCQLLGDAAEAYTSDARAIRGR